MPLVIMEVRMILLSCQKVMVSNIRMVCLIVKRWWCQISGWFVCFIKIWKLEAEFIWWIFQYLQVFMKVFIFWVIIWKLLFKGVMNLWWGEIKIWLGKSTVEGLFLMGKWASFLFVWGLSFSASEEGDFPHPLSREILDL